MLSSRGPYLTFEIDKAKFGQRKYNRERLADGMAVFEEMCMYLKTGLFHKHTRPMKGYTYIFGKNLHQEIISKNFYIILDSLLIMI
ncbi:hypothetical protein HZS_5849 [Henneguya salminicola]|nr:hypothetical protein HZS_5849 [Henneguya salminicola]